MFSKTHFFSIVLFSLLLLMPSSARADGFDFYGYGGPASIGIYGTGPATLGWSADSAAKSCLVTSDGGWSKEKIFGDGNTGFGGLGEWAWTRSGTFTSPGLSQTTTFSFTCFAADGTSLFQKPVTITVLPKVEPIAVTISADSLALPVGGGTVTLSWTVRGATSCHLDGTSTDGRFLSVDIAPSDGSRGVPLGKSATFEFRCVDDVSLRKVAALGYQDPALSFYQLIRVTVDSGRPSLPSILLQTTPNGVPATGGTVALLWNVNDNGVLPESVCQAVGWTDNGVSTLDRKAPLDTVYTQFHRSSPQTVTAPKIFTIECTNKWGTSRRSVEVRVATVPGCEITVTCDYSPPILPSTNACGNGIKDAGEACDAGAANNGFCPKSCSSSCAINDCGAGRVDGQCAATHDLCLAGTSINSTNDSAFWRWSCQGTGGGATVQCQEAKNGSCVPDNTCATTTCSDATCVNNCGTPIVGTKGCQAPYVPGVIAKATPIAQILANVLNFLLSVAGVIGIIGLVVAGVLYLVASGDEGRVRLAKRMALYCVIGIVVVLGALVLVTQLVSFLTQ